MKSKFFMFFMLSIFLIFLIGNVNAIVVYGEWENGKQNIEINKGEDVSFNVGFSSRRPPIIANIKFYDSSYNLIYSFEKNKLEYSNKYYNTYFITENIYKMDGKFEVVLIGSDSFPNSDTHTLSLTVKDTSRRNHPPRIRSTPIRIVKEGEVYNYQIVASDPDGDTLAYYLVKAPEWLSINSRTGLIRGIAPLVNKNTRFSVTVMVSDKKGKFVTKSYTLTVRNTVTKKNHPPVITSTPPKYILEEDLYSYLIFASDPDGDTLKYTLTKGPGWLYMYEDAGVLVGPAPLVDEDTKFRVGIKVSDGKGGVATQSFTLIVKDITFHWLKITSEPITEVNEKKRYRYPVVVESQKEKERLSYVLTSSPKWLSINSKTGVIRGRAPAVNKDKEFNVIVRVTDGMYFDTQSFKLKVRNIS